MIGRRPALLVTTRNTSVGSTDEISGASIFKLILAKDSHSLSHSRESVELRDLNHLMNCADRFISEGSLRGLLRRLRRHLRRLSDNYLPDMLVLIIFILTGEE